MFSKTCEYAIRALIFIAQRSKRGERVGIKEVAESIGSPEHFIAKILQELVKKQLVTSYKGPNGGFFLEPNSSITLADVVLAMDGEKLFSGCGLGLENCSESCPCPIHYQFKKIRTDFSEMLRNAKLIEFSAQLDNKKTFLRSVSITE